MYSPPRFKAAFCTRFFSSSCRTSGAISPFASSLFILIGIPVFLETIPNASFVSSVEGGEGSMSDSFINLKLHSKYHISEKLSIHLNIDNILNHYNEIYFMYPELGTNLLSGLTWKF